MIVLLSVGLASAAEVCHWEVSWTTCTGTEARVCQPTRFEGTNPTDAEARHACYEARATPAANHWTKEEVLECAIRCEAGAPLSLPSVALQEGAAPELRAAVYRVRPALAECVATLPTPPAQVTVYGNVANGKLRVTRIEGTTPAVTPCLTTALQDTVEAGPNAGTTLTLRWAAPKP